MSHRSFKGVLFFYFVVYSKLISRNRSSRFLVACLVPLRYRFSEFVLKLLALSGVGFASASWRVAYIFAAEEEERELRERAEEERRRLEGAKPPPLMQVLPVSYMGARSIGLT